MQDMWKALPGQKAISKILLSWMQEAGIQAEEESPLYVHSYIPITREGENKVSWMIVCCVCGKQVIATRENKAYCSRACQMRAFRRRKKKSQQKLAQG